MGGDTREQKMLYRVTYPESYITRYTPYTTRTPAPGVGGSSRELRLQSVGHLPLRKRIDGLLSRQRNLLHACFTNTTMVQPCSNFRCRVPGFVFRVSCSGFKVQTSARARSPRVRCPISSGRVFLRNKILVYLKA